MAPYHYDKNRFLDRVSDLSLGEILEAAAKEARNVESELYNVKGAKARRDEGGGEYARFLKGVLFFLSRRIPPDGLSDDEFGMLRPLCENVVKKGAMNPDVLELFD